MVHKKRRDANLSRLVDPNGAVRDDLPDRRERDHARDDGTRYFSAGWTYDERIEDGLYSYISLQGIRQRIENPETLEAGADDLRDS